MGKMVLITVASVSLTGALMLLNMKQSTTAAERQIHQYRGKQDARNAARAGYARIRRYVWERWSQGEIVFEDTLGGTYAGGTYEARVVSTDTAGRAEAEVTVDGRFAQTRPPQSHAIDVVFSTPTQASVPKALQYAMMSDGSLQLSGNATIESDSGHVNSDVHTNQNLAVSGAPNSVEGFGTYSGSKVFSPPGSESSIFDPNTNPDGDTAVRQSAEIDVPTFNPDDYEADAHQRTGTVNWTGTEVVDFTTLGAGVGTEENPAIWYVDGGLNVSGSVEVRGYGVMVVTGSINVSGGAATSQAATPPGWLGLYADGSINMSGNTQIHGQLFANGSVSVSGTPEIHGSVTSGGTIQMSGTPDLSYRRADPALTQPIWGGSQVEELEVAAYSEW